MAEFITTSGNSHYIEKIIMQAKKTLVLTTPFLKLSDTVLKRLTDANRRGVNITVIYGKNELQKSEREKLDALGNLELYYCGNLHAKCYHNEDSLVISSMNLYEFSEKHNREMGVYFTLSENEDIFNSALAEIESIINSSERKKGRAIEKPTDETTRVNLHLEPLLQLLKIDYQRAKWYSEKEELLVVNFPIKGLDMIISHRIVLQFDSEVKLNECKSKLENATKRNNFRIFHPKKDQVTIYPGSNMSWESDSAGIKNKAEYFRKMVGTFSIVELFS